MHKIPERRKFKRYRVCGGAIVMLKKKNRLPGKKPQYIKLGPITDISNKGLSIQYIAGIKKPEDSVDLAIATLSGQIIIDNIKFISVYDNEIGLFPNGETIRKKAVKFIDMSGIQKAWIACLINNLKSRQTELGNTDFPSDRPPILCEVL